MATYSSIVEWSLCIAWHKSYINEPNRASSSTADWILVDDGNGQIYLLSIEKEFNVYLFEHACC